MSNPTAAIIIIGNEILSGRTLDLNTKAIAEKLSDKGIELHEVRVIPDNKEVIINTTLELKNKYTYIFSTGGIGPTHDDITSAALAEAFNLELECNKEAYNIIKASYLKRGEQLNPAREKMAYIPAGCSLIYNPVSGAPGFIIENIYVMAGVPHIMQAMLELLLPRLKGGEVIQSKSHEFLRGESLIAAELTSLQNKYPDVDIGSYPFEKENKHGTNIVLRSANSYKLNQAFNELQAIIEKKKI